MYIYESVIAYCAIKILKVEPNTSSDPVSGNYQQMIMRVISCYGVTVSVVIRRYQQGLSPTSPRIAVWTAHRSATVSVSSLHVFFEFRVVYTTAFPCLSHFIYEFLFQ